MEREARAKWLTDDAELKEHQTMNQSDWNNHYLMYREKVKQTLYPPSRPVIVVSPDNDDLPAEEYHDAVQIGSYDEHA